MVSAPELDLHQSQTCTPAPPSHIPLCSAPVASVLQCSVLAGQQLFLRDVVEKRRIHGDGKENTISWKFIEMSLFFQSRKSLAIQRELAPDFVWFCFAFYRYQTQEFRRNTQAKAEHTA